jgi:hypothetical protein
VKRYTALTAERSVKRLKMLKKARCPMTLKEDIIALQERCKKELGVDVTIWINADNISQTVDQQNAERIAEMIVSAFDGTAKHVNQGDYN